MEYVNGMFVSEGKMGATKKNKIAHYSVVITTLLFSIINIYGIVDYSFFTDEMEILESKKHLFYLYVVMCLMCSLSSIVCYLKALKTYKTETARFFTISSIIINTTFIVMCAQLRTSHLLLSERDVRNGGTKPFVLEFRGGELNVQDCKIPSEYKSDEKN